MWNLQTRKIHRECTSEYMLVRNSDRENLGGVRSIDLRLVSIEATTLTSDGTRHMGEIGTYHLEERETGIAKFFSVVMRDREEYDCPHKETCRLCGT